MRDDGDSLLDKLFPGAPPHERVTRATSNLGSPQYLTSHEGRKVAASVNGRWASICTLELRGLPQNKIAATLGMSPQSVSNIVNDDRYIAYRTERLALLDEEFVAMKPLAFAALRGGLSSADENTALRASETWFKGASFGGYSKTERPATTLTAEDIAAELLRQHTAPLVQVNTQVNVSPVSPVSPGTPTVATLDGE